MGLMTKQMVFLKKGKGKGEYSCSNQPAAAYMATVKAFSYRASVSLTQEDSGGFSYYTEQI